MYVAITRQKAGNTYANSVADYVAYLEKENQELAPEMQEHFFDQYNDRISPEKVIQEIDGNTAKLKKKEPKFYSIIVNPSQRELKHIQNNPEKLRAYTRELMKEYAKCFYRDETVTVDNIKYYAKIEKDRSYRGFDQKVKENQEYKGKIVKLENDIRKVERGELKGNTSQMKNEIKNLTAQIPHRVNGEILVSGMKKPGMQTHIHIIVSRKDASNTKSLSPGSVYKASEVILNGTKQKRGFDRDKFYEAAEKTFDSTTGYNRNYVESYKGQKQFIKDPKHFYAKLLGLPVSERAIAFKLIRKTGLDIPIIPTSTTQLAVSAFRKLKRGLEIALRSGSIGY
ncbi:MobB family relaxase [uncultured Maribacter sp.]|uniref:MobB family relaxase n=1 Tax=uncultured Maribacter sp. TaxID=431308 RepID=UPI002612AC71|nr:MobB family relaxase [uncultured Maribacter sp.]